MSTETLRQFDPEIAAAGDDEVRRQANGLELTAGKTFDAIINAGSDGSYALYDRALTEPEILDHWNGGAGKSYCDEAPSAPVIVSTPVSTGTVGQLYTYDVDATDDVDAEGSGLTFSLDAASIAAGMSIDAQLFEGGVEYFVLQGSFRDHDGDYHEGTWLRLPCGSRQAIHVTSDCRVFRKSGHLLNPVSYA